MTQHAFQEASFQHATGEVYTSPISEGLARPHPLSNSFDHIPIATLLHYSSGLVSPYHSLKTLKVPPAPTNKHNPHPRLGSGLYVHQPSASCFMTPTICVPLPTPRSLFVSTTPEYNPNTWRRRSIHAAAPESFSLANMSKSLRDHSCEHNHS
ncbi:hypothetical protein CROQUDRAFT_100656 [Cronartium quercuum f. sp. fusiforme G11]|uniref:Uncharacterized protein n=1 Tax=Cronartium quercuum f. sp. fusiforme G11 TaxID=708437 RepID=A0A9P6N5Z0_9BASI|nr:hypothetical protein CROQUDRAFT_100656 [Cronartium quercuum f. sp. fusiforme G11]